MPELTQQEKLQPSLLDRLTDFEPEKKNESRNDRVLSMRRLREVVQRDLGWLFNTCCLDVTQDLDNYPEVQKSVINYGLTDLAGYSASGLDVVVLERLVKKSIRDYEPRILEETLTVEVVVNDDEMSVNTLAFEIRGELWAQPVPLQLFLKTEVDLEDGQVTVKEQDGR